MNATWIHGGIILLLSISLSAVATVEITQFSRGAQSAALTFATMPGERYQVQCSTNLFENQWIDLGDEVEASAESTGQSVDVSGAVCFFRVVKAPDAASASGEIIDFSVQSERLELTFATTSGMLYQLQCCTNLAENAWLDLGEKVAAVAKSTVLSSAVSGASCYYRVIETEESVPGVDGGPPEVPTDPPEPEDPVDPVDPVDPTVPVAPPDPPAPPV